VHGGPGVPDGPGAIDLLGERREDAAVRALEGAEPHAQRRRAERTTRHRAEVEVDAGPGRDRLEAMDREHHAHELALVDPQAGEPLVGHPVPRHLEPVVADAAGLRGTPALAVALLEPHLGGAQRAVHPRGVGDVRPQRLRRP
jgi:hypothetical protein